LGTLNLAVTARKRQGRIKVPFARIALDHALAGQSTGGSAQVWLRSATSLSGHKTLAGPLIGDYHRLVPGKPHFKLVLYEKM
jgi:hypothetical protein